MAPVPFLKGVFPFPEGPVTARTQTDPGFSRGGSPPVPADVEIPPPELFHVFGGYGNVPYGTDLDGTDSTAD